MKRTGVLFLFALLLIAGVVEGQSGNTAPSGAYSVQGQERDYSITFSGKDFTGSWEGVSISGTFSVSRSNLTLNLKGASRGIPSKMNWTIVDANTLKDHDGDVWRKGGRDQGRDGQPQTTTTGFAPESAFRVTLTNDGTGAVITKYTGDLGSRISNAGGALDIREIRIPPTIQDMPVREIGESAFSNDGGADSDIRIFIPEGVTKIGASAFAVRYGGGKFSITIPDSVTEIGARAFADRPLNTSITLPKSLTSLGDGAFADTGITGITLPASLRNIGNGMFSGCQSSLTSVTLSEGMTSIPTGMFKGFSALSTINLPASIVEIGAEAFSGCRRLTSITLPASIRQIGNDAFRNTGITNITLPASISQIGTGAFRDTRITSITIPASITKIENNTFQGSSLQTLTLPDSIKEIGAEAFRDCRALTTITIPDSVTQISFGANAFSGCTNLTLAAQALLKRKGYSGSF